MIRVIDDVLPDPQAYRAEALAQEFGDVTIGPDTFRGIAPCPRAEVAAAAAKVIPDAEPVLSWRRTRCVDARFNRLLLFSAELHHSRALFSNYGASDDARLIQVVFLR